MTDTLSIDTLAVAQWRGNPEFDYGAEFKSSDFSLMDWIGEKLDCLLGGLFSQMGVDKWGTAVMYVLGFAAIASVVVFMFYRHPELLRLRRQSRPSADYTVEEDTIYGVDFPAAISAAMSRSDYREAVRLSYLQTLRLLSDAGIVEWQLSKTPDQYTAEFADTRFRRMTLQFVRVRYGGFEATVDMAVDMQQLFSEIEGQLAVKGEEGGNA